MTTIPETIPTYNAVDEVPADVNDCWIGDVLYHRCGAGRKVNRENFIPPCGELKPCKTGYYNSPKAPLNAEGDRKAISCSDCTLRHKAAKREKQKEYTAETPRDRAVVVFTSTPQVQTELGVIRLGVTAENDHWFPVRPMLSLTRFEGENSLYDAVARDPLLRLVVRYAEQLSTDGKRYEMLHLPWRFWPHLLTKFGNALTLPLQQAIQRIIEQAFGTTREEVRDNVSQAVNGNALRNRTLSNALRRNPAYIRNLARLLDTIEAEQARREQVKETTAAALRQVQDRKAEVAHMLSAINAEEAAAYARDVAAENELRQVTAEYESMLAQADELDDGEAQQLVYLWGPKDPGSCLLIDGKVGDTINIRAKQKELSYGNKRDMFHVKKPCDDGETCAAIILAYLCRNGAQKVGRDHFNNAQGDVFARVVLVLNAMDYITPDDLLEHFGEEAA